MDIYIDDKPFVIRHSESFSREDMLHMIKEEIASQGRVLTDIVCTGESLEESDFLSIPDAVEVYFMSNTEEEIMAEVLEQVFTSLNKMGSSLDDWVTGLASSVQPSEKDIAAFQEDLVWVTGILEEASESFKDFKISLPVSSVVSWSDDFDAFLSYIKEGAFQEALLRLEEDLLPEINRLSGLFKELYSEWKKKNETCSTDQK